MNHRTATRRGHEPGGPTLVHLSDYTAPPYLVDEVELEFDLHDDHALVHSRLSVRRGAGVSPETPLVLDGEELVLEALRLDGAAVPEGRYRVDEAALTIEEAPEQFTLEVITHIRPQDNTRLEGLYRSGGMFCTQCEAEGFRRITYFPIAPM
ncbi:MAG: hypothetical protein U5L11_06190 [Arhodomonas sp.]|nr:hypothetical protein [Arhodomonas sp.]